MGAVVHIDPEWRDVEVWAKEELANAVGDLKSITLDHDATQVRRGMVLILEKLLELPAKRVVAVPGQDLGY